MTSRISEERFQQLKYHFDCGNNSFDRDTAKCFAELEQSRAVIEQLRDEKSALIKSLDRHVRIVTELRALAERMRDCSMVPSVPIGTAHWLRHIDSLLAAHDTQQAETSFCVETAAASIALHQTEMQRRSREAEVHLVASQDLNKDDAEMIISVVDLLDTQQAEGKEVEILWCVHVIGPDDLIAAPSVEAAREAAERANKHFQALAILPGEMHFEAMRWPHSKESHAKSLVNDWPGLQPRGSAQAEGKAE